MKHEETSASKDTLIKIRRPHQKISTLKPGIFSAKFSYVTQEFESRIEKERGVNAEKSRSRDYEWTFEYIYHEFSFLSTVYFERRRESKALV